MAGFVPPCSQVRRQWFYKELQSHETLGCAWLEQRILFGETFYFGLFYCSIWGERLCHFTIFWCNTLIHYSELEDLIQPNWGSDDGGLLGKLGRILFPLIPFVRILRRIFCETELIKLKCPQCQPVHHCYQFKFSRFLSAQIDNWQFQRFSAMTWNALGIEIISAVFCVNMFLKWTKLISGNILIMLDIEAQKWPRKVTCEQNAFQAT